VNAMGRVLKLVDRLKSTPDVEGKASPEDSVSEGKGSWDQYGWWGVLRRRRLGVRIGRRGRSRRRHHVESRACTR